ncbi:Holliday junction branch migration protein RuvA [bacterium]|nr:MAG: Holliday junction branch migration protein RuvA [bacterium]
MIAFLDGILVSGGTAIVVQVGGGMGLDVQVSALCAERLPVPGETVRLWTHLAVREDAWSLYGFVDVTEREMFRLLISVSGIGPKVALGMLSRAHPEDIAGHLRLGDEKALAGLPGIGKKSAARLVVELGQRVPELVAGTGGTTTSAGPLPEAVAVLGAMGLPAIRAEAALMRVREKDPAVSENMEHWVRAALRVI